MKLAKYVMKKIKRMTINMFRLFLGIAVQKFPSIFDFGSQIINWTACSMTPIFMNTCIFTSSEIALLYYYLFCYCNLWLHTNTPRLIESDFHKLITNWEVHSSLLNVVSLSFSLNIVCSIIVVILRRVCISLMTE